MDWQAVGEWFGAGGGAVRLLRIIGILAGAWLIATLLTRLIARVRRRLNERLVRPEQLKRAETLTRVFRYAGSVVLTLVAAVLVLAELDISVAPILGAAGIVGIAVGFGAQNLVKDYFTGMFLLIENQLATGDVVTIAGLSGTVEDMTLRHVRLRDASGHVHYISNGLITTVTNRTQGFAYAVMDISVGYGEDVDHVISVLAEVGSEMKAEPQYAARILEPLDISGVDSLGNNAVVIRCRFKTRAPEQWSVRREFLKRVKAAFDARGIEIPFPQLTLHVASPGAPDNPPARES